LVRAAGHQAAPPARGHAAVRVCLLIPTHALPPLSYRVPARLRRRVAPGSLVVAPLSGRSRLGVVLGGEAEPNRDLEDIVSVAEGLSVPPDLLEVCRWVGESAAVPLPTVLRAAIPPGIDAGRFVIANPEAGWPWAEGDVVSRPALKRELGPEGLKEAEEEGRVLLAPAAPARKDVEWAVVREAAKPDLSRAPRQRRILEHLKERGGALQVATLLAGAGSGRPALRELVRRGAVRLVRRPEPAPLLPTSGDYTGVDFDRDASRAVGRGGAFVWRVPTGDQPDAVAAVARAVVGEGEQALVLAPEIETVERIARDLSRALPPGHAVAAYHSGLGRDRAAVFEAARHGEADVIVGTRAAALLPLARPGAFCVVDEHDESHRAEPGYEGIPIHARDVAIARGRAEGAVVVCLSPTPSLRLYAAPRRGGSGVGELPARPTTEWPAVRIVDMRGSGAVLSSTLLDTCRRLADDGGRAGVVVDRLGYASAVSCNRCGSVRRCPECDLPLALHDGARSLVCSGCGRREARHARCPDCGSERLSPSGVAVEKVREELSTALGEPVGLLTAGRVEHEGAAVVAGTARCVLRERWDAVLLPDVDAVLQGGGIGAAERSFRLVYHAAESARGMLQIQTRTPEHYVLRAAARDDYESFVAAEVPRLRAAGYPPFAHLATVVLSGPRGTVFGAVESRLRAGLGAEVQASEPVPVAASGGRPSWKVLLRSRDRRAVALVAGQAARLAAETRGLEARILVNPEEV
jgi:primosomal protein N' (replication factor Y) (superfamily II helicase)